MEVDGEKKASVNVKGTRSLVGVRFKPRQINLFPQIEQLMNHVAIKRNENSGRIEMKNVTLIHPALQNVVSRPTSTQGYTVARKLPNTLLSVPAPVFISSTNSPKSLCNSHSSSLMQFSIPVKPIKESKGDNTALISSASRLSLKRIQFLNCKKNGGSCGNSMIRFRIAGLKNPPIIIPHQQKQRCIFSSSLSQRTLRVALIPRKPCKAYNIVPKEPLHTLRHNEPATASTSNLNESPLYINQYTKNRVKTADPDQCVTRDRHDTRYDKRSLFASLDTGRNDAPDPGRIRIVEMNFAQSAKQHLILPSCWT